MIELKKDPKNLNKIAQIAHNGGAVVWLCGLAGSGKSTLGRAFASRLREQYDGVIYIDGDIVRDIFVMNGYNRAARVEAATKYSQLAELIAKQNQIAVCATISLFNEIYERNKTRIARYFEVFVECDLKELQARDQKGLYSGAIRGEIADVVGINLPYDPPNPHLIINNTERENLEQKVDLIYDEFIKKFG